MRRASRSREIADGQIIDLVVTRCINVQRNVFNEDYCKISYEEDACESVPKPEINDAGSMTSFQKDPGGLEPVSHAQVFCCQAHHGFISIQFLCIP